jgi:hypothetical protein
MTRNEINVYLAAILTTLHDLNTDCAESTVYLRLGCDFGKYETLRRILVAGGLVTIQDNRISLTTEGHAMAEKCNAALASR